MDVFKTIFSKINRTSSTPALNIDDGEFLITDGVLEEYRGESDTFIIPAGVTSIANHGTCICKQTIDTVFIPKTVASSLYEITDCDLCSLCCHRKT